MALVFPLAMPSVGVGQQVFEPLDVNDISVTAGGGAYGVAVGLTRWKATWTLAQALSQAQSDAWRAVLAALDGPNRQFLGLEVGRSLPLNYPNGFTGLSRAGGGSFDGSFTGWSQSIASDGQALATFNGAPAGFAMKAGDYVDFRWTTSTLPRRHMVRLLEDATANGSGIISAVSVYMPIHPTVVPGSAVAHVDNAACIMRLDPANTSVTPMDRRRVAGATIVGIQDLRA